MNIPINYAKWSAPNLPAGLKIKNGIISGSPTVEVGNYAVPFTVRTPWGTDTKNINFHVLNKEKYAIYQNGEKLEDVSLSDLIASIRNGIAQEKYNCNDTQIMIPITTPALYYRYRDADIKDHEVDRPSQTDMVAVNFCSFRNVTLQDGTVRPGLILQFDKTIWKDYCCFDTGDSAIAVHYNVYYGDYERIGYMCNRWKYSTLRQWLNSSGSNWFSKAYDTDGFLTIPSDREERDRLYFYLYSQMRDENSIGFLSCLPESLLEAIQPVKIQTQAYFDEDNFDETLEEPDIINDVYVDVTYDKIFIPSLEEMNIKPSDEYGYNNGKKCYADDGIEGTAWEYYLNKFGSTSRLVDGNSFSGMDKWGFDLTYDFEKDPEQAVGYQYQSHYTLNRPRGHFTRSANLEDSKKFWECYLAGYDDVAGNFDSTTIYQHTYLCVDYNECRADFNTYAQPAPAFVLC